MAGVFGLLGTVDQRVLRAMACRLAHRGQTMDAREVAQGVGLGCMADHSSVGLVEQHGCTMAADLALYNESELRAELALQTEGAGRLILEAYRRLEGDGFAMINGDFALALWDDDAKQLVLARDFAGVRPLYFAPLPSGGLAFASEYKALLAIDEVAAEPDLDMVQWLQHTKHLPSGRTLLRAVRAVPPGTALAFDGQGQTIWEKRMPALELAVERMAMDAARDSVADAFMRAMERRIARKSVVGVALSGGIDSIGVACASRQLLPNGEIHTFTAGSGADDPEIMRAEFVADRIGAIQHSVPVTPAEVTEHLPELVWHLEHPIARTEAVQFYALGQKARGLVDTILTGVAADGLFAGMPRHKILWLIEQLPFLRGPLTEFYGLTQAGRLPETILGSLLDRIYFRGSLPAVPAIKGSRYRPTLPEFPANGREFVNRVLCAGFQESVASWLPKLERTLRAGGVSFASPFLDRDLMRVAFTIPGAYKIRRGKEKYVLRQAIRSIVPAQVLSAPKFPMRMQHDRAFSDTLDSLADRILSWERVEQRGFMDFAAVDGLRRRQPGRPYSSEGAMRLWTALLTEIWAQEFLDLRGARLATIEDLRARESISVVPCNQEARARPIQDSQPAST
jgi:asparagine synthase (glutamine-hydrolysing)